MKLEVAVSVFDPVFPEILEPVVDVAIDNWYKYSIITKEMWSKINNVPKEGEDYIYMSSGMQVKLPYIEIGIKVGNIKLKNVKALVTESGDYELILGNNATSKIFEIGGSGSTVELTNKLKNDESFLSIKIHSLSETYSIYNFENFLREQRRIFNILMIVNGDVEFDDSDNIDEIIDTDKYIPKSKSLQLSWIEKGSIFLSLKSAAKSLKSLGKLFGEAKLSELKKEFYEAEKNKTESEILKETRNSIILRKKEEEKKITAENIHATYETWRKEVRERIQFQEELIKKVNDPVLAEKLNKKLNDSIEILLNQNLFPELINLPDEKLLGDNPSNLPILFRE